MISKKRSRKMVDKDSTDLQLLSDSIVTNVFELRGYYVSNRNHMKYDEYRRNGWYIGSGSIESANKYIITQRLKLTGMQWNKLVADAMIWARCKYFENDWDKFWDSMSLSNYLDNTPTNWGIAA